MNEMITIPRTEYDRLREAVEDLADMLAYERAMADSGESIPADAVKRMIEGEIPVRVYRELRGHSQTALATVSGVNRVQIADIEAKRSNGSVETMRKLAAALNVTVDDLI